MILERGRAAMALLAALAATVVGAAPAAAAGSTYTVQHRTFDVGCTNGVGSVAIDLTYVESDAADLPHQYAISTVPSQTRITPTVQGTHTDHVVFADLAPANYTLTFTNPDGSAQTAVAPVCGTAINLEGSHQAVYGQRVTLTADLFALQYPYPRIAGATLRVYRALLGGSSQLVGTVVTGVDGRADVDFTATASAYWSVRWSGDARHTGNVSNGAPVSVRQTVGVAPTSQSVRRGTNATVYGTVTPGVAGGYVYVQYEDGDGVWRNLNRGALMYQRLPNGQTAVGYVIRFAPLGANGIYRTVRPATSTLAHGTSRIVFVTQVSIDHFR